MLLCKQEEAGIQLNAEQADWRNDTDDDELEDQELEAHYMYMAQLQQVSLDAADSRPIFDDEPLQKVSNDDHYNVFAMKSTHLEQSKSVHDTYPIEQDTQNVIIDSLDMSDDREEIDQNDDDNDLAKERALLASLIEKLKCEIDESKNRNKFLETSNKALIEKLKGEIKDFKNKNKSLESLNNFFKEANNRLSEINNLLYADYKKSEVELARRNSKEYASHMELECTKVREMKNKLFAHQETISILSKQKEAQIKLYKTQEDKELDKVIELENKVKVLDNIIYKTGQSVQTINMLNNKCRTSFAKPEFLKKAQRANPRLYDTGCYSDNLALMLAPDSDEVIRLEKESRSKLRDLIRTFDYDKLNNLYDLFISQCEKSSEQCYFSERSRLSHINVNNGKSKESFNKQTTLLEKRMDESIPLDKQCLETKLSKSKMMSKSFELVQKHAINLELELQQCKEKIKNDMLFKVNKTKDFCKEREQYFEIQDLKAQLQDKGIVIRVILTTSVSRPQLKSNPQGDRVMHNNSQGKKQTVKDHRRSVKLSKNKTKLYELVSKTCSWWYPKFTPSGYKWKPKSGKENVNPNLVDIVLFIIDSGCSKNIMGNLKLLINFVEKFLGTNDIVVGLPKVKFVKDHLCSSCELGKTKRKSFHAKLTPSSKRRLQLLHMDLCGLMRPHAGSKYKWEKICISNC
nr:hypothetical protein [Tanacetum cinerariifolium]